MFKEINLCQTAINTFKVLNKVEKLHLISFQLVFTKFFLCFGREEVPLFLGVYHMYKLFNLYRDASVQYKEKS